MELYKNTRTPATGVTIVGYRRWTGQINKKICLHDGVMAVDLKLPRRLVRILAVYLPNAWNYDLDYFQSIFEDIERLSMEAMDKGYALVIAGDFNLSIEQGERGKIMIEFCEQFSMDIANRNPIQVDNHSWTYKSSIWGLLRLDYILHSKNLRSFEVSANYELDLGSDHRNVSTSLEFIRSQETWKKRQISFKGWKPKLNELREPHEYHDQLQEIMDESLPTNLHELREIAIRAAKVGGTSFQRPKDTKRPYQSKELKDMILQRREALDDYSRRNMSKKIYKLARKEL